MYKILFSLPPQPHSFLNSFIYDTLRWDYNSLLRSGGDVILSDCDEEWGKSMWIKNRTSETSAFVEIWRPLGSFSLHSWLCPSNQKKSYSCFCLILQVQEEILIVCMNVGAFGCLPKMSLRRCVISIALSDQLWTSNKQCKGLPKS